MLDLYKPFTSASGSMPNYIIMIRNFIRNLQFFRLLQDSDIETTDTSVRFDFTSLGIYKMYLTIQQAAYYSAYRSLTFVMPYDAHFNRTDASEMYAENAKILTMQTPYTSGFWFNTPNTDYICKFFITESIDMETNAQSKVFISTLHHISNPSDDNCKIYYTDYDMHSASINVKYDKFTDSSTYVLDPLTYDTRRFPDLFVISGGDVNTPYSEVMTLNSVQYVQLVGNIYIKNSSIS